MREHKSDLIRLDLSTIADLIEPGSRVLDLGCGEGDLLCKLMEEKECWGQGIEIVDENVVACIEKSVPVIHANLDDGLKDYPDSSFDYVILSRTLQVVRRPDLLLQDMLRVGRKCIISFPNFSAFKVRSQLFFKGRMPVTRNLPYHWYDTPNIHLLTIKDFKSFCKKYDVEIMNQINLGSERKHGILPDLAPNLFAHLAIFKIKCKTHRKETHEE